FASEAVGIAKPPQELALNGIVKPTEGLGKGERRLFCGRRSGRFGEGSCFLPRLLGQGVDKLFQGPGLLGKLGGDLFFAGQGGAGGTEEKPLAIMKLLELEPGGSQLVEICRELVLLDGDRGAQAGEAGYILRQQTGLGPQSRDGRSKQHGGAYGSEGIARRSDEGGRRVLLQHDKTCQNAGELIIAP